MLRKRRNIKRSILSNYFTPGLSKTHAILVFGHFLGPLVLASSEARQTCRSAQPLARSFRVHEADLGVLRTERQLQQIQHRRRSLYGLSQFTERARNGQPKVQASIVDGRWEVAARH